MAHVRVVHDIDPARVAGLDPPAAPAALARGFARFVRASWQASLADLQQRHEVTVAVGVRAPGAAPAPVEPEGAPSVTVDYLADADDARALAAAARQALAPEDRLLAAFRALSADARRELAEAPETDAWRMPAHPRDSERL